jgi:hypothetical protein
MSHAKQIADNVKLEEYFRHESGLPLMSRELAYRPGNENQLIWKRLVKYSRVARNPKSSPLNFR